MFMQKTTFEAAEMILGPWNQQFSFSFESKTLSIDLFIVPFLEGHLGENGPPNRTKTKEIARNRK